MFYGLCKLIAICHVTEKEQEIEKEIVGDMSTQSAVEILLENAGALKEVVCVRARTHTHTH